MSAPPRGRRIITLTTDFGLRDEYVGTMKGVILCRCPDATIVDLTHGIMPQDVREAAMTIGASYRFFPAGTVHMVVVDPGVGSDRRILAVKTTGHLFIAPDNGVLTAVLTGSGFRQAFHVNNRNLFAKTVSASFHGRDIMAPVAAALACGMDISLVGPPLTRKQCCRISLPSATVAKGNIIGQIIHIDHFGNLRTSITADHFRRLAAHPKGRIEIGAHAIPAISTTYADAGPGTPVALFDSRHHLEIAVNGGNAARTLGCRVGDTVVVIPEGP